MSFVDRCGKPWIIEQEIQQITTVAIPSPIDANGSCVASQTLSPIAVPTIRIRMVSSRVVCIEIIAWHRLFSAARWFWRPATRRVTAGGRPCAADPSLWKSPPQVINTREIRLRNSWQAEQDLRPQGRHAGLDYDVAS